MKILRFRLSIHTIFFLLFIVFIGSDSVLAQRSLKPHLPITRVDFFYTLSDGVILDCTKFIPTGSPPSGGWPAVIITHGLGLSKYTDIDDAMSLAQDGFYSLVYSMRGQGASGGLSNLISTTEMNDLMQMVQYVKNDANTNDNKIAIHGGSQGGILPFMAACNGMDVHTIICDLASPEFASSWIENGCVKMTLLWSLSYTPDIIRYNSQVASYKNWIYSSQRDKWDSLAHYMPIGRDFLAQVSNCTTPILFQNAWQDKFFNSLGIIKSAYLLDYNLYRMYFGAMDGHGSDYNQGEINFQSNVQSDWYDYWLYGIQNGVMNSANKFVYASSRFPVLNRDFWTWGRTNSPSWPPAGVQTVKLYMYPGNQLLPVAYNGGVSSVSFVNDVVDTTVTLQYLVNTEFHGPLFDAKFHKQETYFETPALLQDCQMAGNINVGLYYSSTASGVCQYNFQLFEVTPTGRAKLVTRANYTDRNYTQNEAGDAYFPGVSYSHIFKAGNRIRLVATNLDNVPLYDSVSGDTTDTFLRTNPFVLPVLKRGTNSIQINGTTQSYIELPLQNFVIGVKKISAEVPKQFKLYQNYPNPFNPTTKIKYDVKRQMSDVKLIVYDIQGKVVDVLVDQMQNAGTYEAEWNASKFASGIYFYKLDVGEFTDIKKMVLLK